MTTERLQARIDADRAEMRKEITRSYLVLAEIPAVGVLSAMAVVATTGDPKAFRSGREFAALPVRAPRSRIS